MSRLRDVLDAFQDNHAPLSMNQLCKKLSLSPPMLEEMLQYWIRKGKLREVITDNCQTCGDAHGCPFVVDMPRRFELARQDGLSSCQCQAPLE